LKISFEVIRDAVAEARMPPFSVVINKIMTDFQLGFVQVAEATAG
jgi:hypothetical protein